MLLPTQLSLVQDSIQISSCALRFENKWNVQRHCNAEWEFHFIRKGKCVVDVGQTQCHLQEGQALLIKPGLYHQARTITAEFTHFTLGFMLSDGGIATQLSDAVDIDPVFCPDGSLCQTIDRLADEIKSSDVYTQTYTDALIRCLIVELLRHLGIGTGCVQNPADSDQIQLTQTIDTFFEQHFSEACGEEMLAKQLHFSRRHLVRILKKHYGMSFREKLTHARMDYAAFLLRTTDKPISRIGAEAGYDSESAFFKVFRRTFCMTPRQYRISHK